MSPSGPAGWYPDPDVPRQQRYWTGNAWTDHRESVVMLDSPRDQGTANSGASSEDGRAWHFHAWVASTVAIGAGLLGLTVALGAGGTGSTSSTESKSSAGAAFADVQAKLARQEVGRVRRRGAVDAGKKAVLERREAVGIVEPKVGATTVSGGGRFQVGRDMKPGSYRSSGANGCSYVVLNSAFDFDIAVKNTVSGPASVTVRPGQFFETTRCADWVWQR